MEYCTQRVSPEYEQDLIQLMHSFGWQYVSSQEFYHESEEIVDVQAHSYGGFMQGWTGNDGRLDVKTQKNITHFVSVRFQRDPQMPQYETLKKLQEEFESKMNENPPKKPIVPYVITGCSALLCIGGIGATVQNKSYIFFLIGFAAFTIIMAIFSVIKRKKYLQELAKYQHMIEERQKIYEKAKKITDEIDKQQA